MRPNVLLVVLDAARRDALEPYGAPRWSTPAIADLASRGSAVPHAYATASWTLPSHASMFSGLLPRQMGLGQPPRGPGRSIRGVVESLSERWLPQVLRQAGYATHSFTTNVWVSGPRGFDLGFDTCRYINGGRDDRINALTGQGRRAQLAWAREGWRSSSDDGAANVGRELHSAIASWDGQPTFWFVNLVECHSPYLPPRPWNDLPPWERAAAAIDAKTHLNFRAICYYAAGRHTIPQPALDRMRHLYYRAVSYMDHWLAGVLEALDRKGILDETLVVVTSDHGENFGESGLIAHGFSVDERLIHIPLVMAGPGAGGDELVSLASLPAMIAEAVELNDHPWADSELPDGVAIAQYDPMGSLEIARARCAEEGWDLDDDALERLCTTFTCATDGVHKLVVENDTELLYDLRNDPDETRPLNPAMAADGANTVVSQLRSALEDSAVSRDAVTSLPDPEGRVASDEEVAQIERQMKLLGYM